MLEFKSSDIKTGTLRRYEVRYFSAIDWAWLEYEVIAENEAQILVMVDKKCPISARTKPYSSVPNVDTLEIQMLEEVTLPFVIPEYWRQ